MKSVPITTKTVTSYPAHDKVYSIQHYVINFVSDLQQVGNFLRVLPFPPPIKLAATIELNYFFENGVKHHNPNPHYRSLVNYQYAYSFVLKKIQIAYHSKTMMMMMSALY